MHGDSAHNFPIRTDLYVTCQFASTQQNATRAINAFSKKKLRYETHFDARTRPQELKQELKRNISIGG